MNSAEQYIDAGYVSADSQLETDIRVAELGLGIKNDADRLQEAMLLIDRTFLDGAAIADPANKHPERAFGHNEWLGHLRARQYARDYGNRPLTLELMLGMHAAYTASINSSLAGEILSESCYISGSSADKTLGHVPMNHTTISAVRSNPYVTFVPASASDISKGWIRYGFGMNMHTRQKALQQVCNWYNEARYTYPDQVLLAAQLQRRIVSLHPFPLAVNGRPSRVLMNWSLENAQLPASAPSDFDDDVLVGLPRWRHEVAKGIHRYRRAGQLGMIGCSDAVTLYDLHKENQYYWQTQRHRTETPAPLTPGAHHDRNAYMAFMAILRSGVAMEAKSQQVSDTTEVYNTAPVAYS